MLALTALLCSALLSSCSGQAETRLAGSNVTLARSERDLSWFTSWLPWRRQEEGTTTEPPAVSSGDRKAKCE